MFAREWLQKTLRERGAAQTEIEQAREALNPKVLTIGFARRFATYKRATLFLRDVERIMRIMRDSNRPVQFVIAGKAHPMDIPGKELIRDIVHFIREHDTMSSMVFLPNYDINVARMMVSGCDVWLNTPRHPGKLPGLPG